MKVTLPTFHYRKPSRKQWIIFGLVILTLSGALYGLLSIRAWDSFDAARISRQSEAKTNLQAALVLPARTPEERRNKIKTLEVVTTDYANAAVATCKPQTMIAWQSMLVKAYRERITACESEDSQTSTFMTQLREVLDFLKDEQAVTEILTKLKTDTEVVAEDQWSARLTAWQNTQVSIDKLQTSKGFANVKVKAVEVAKSIAAAWQELIDASAAKDRARYEKALADLGTAYDSLESVGAAAKTALEPLVTDVSNKAQGTLIQG